MMPGWLFRDRVHFLGDMTSVSPRRTPLARAAEDERPRPARVPADSLLHLVPIAAILLLLVNDHVLKGAYPGWITGKLSDVAGLIFFPLFVQAACEVVLDASRRWRGPSLSLLLLSVLGTGLVFAGAETIPVVADLVARTFGTARWPLDAIASLAHSGGLPGLAPASMTADPSDLLALPFLAVPVLLGLRRASSQHHPIGRLR
jgi:hypothetical protein